MTGPVAFAVRRDARSRGGFVGFSGATVRRMRKLRDKGGVARSFDELEAKGLEVWQSASPSQKLRRQLRRQLRQV